MSYSLTSKCWDCTKAARCTDRHVLSGAIQAIHQMPGMNTGDFGHLGAGTIILDCNRYEKKEEPKSADAVQPQVSDWHGQGKQ